MDESTFQRLLDRLKSDRTFAHDLLFEPKRALDELGYLSPEDKDRIAKIDPNAAVRTILNPGNAQDCTVTVQCTQTCTSTASAIDLAAKVSQPGGLAADCTVTVSCGETCTVTVTSKLDQAVDPAVGSLGAIIKGKLGSR